MRFETYRRPEVNGNTRRIFTDERRRCRERPFHNGSATRRWCYTNANAYTGFVSNKNQLARRVSESQSVHRIVRGTRATRPPHARSFTATVYVRRVTSRHSTNTRAPLDQFEKNCLSAKRVFLAHRRVRVPEAYSRPAIKNRFSKEINRPGRVSFVVVFTGKVIVPVDRPRRETAGISPPCRLRSTSPSPHFVTTRIRYYERKRFQRQSLTTFGNLPQQTTPFRK